MRVWLSMIRNRKKLARKPGAIAVVQMDLAGPKLRTGPIEPGPSVIRCRPQREIYGRVVKTARIWLTSADNPAGPPAPAEAVLPVSSGFLKTLRSGDIVRLRDARKGRRTLRVVQLERDGCWAEGRRTTYFVPGLELRAFRRRTGRIKPGQKALRSRGKGETQLGAAMAA